MSTILIACERETERQVLEQTLTGRGHRVLTSRDGIEALDMARAERPSLVVSHVSLPKMDGFALFRKCKQDEDLQLVPFIFFSPRHSDPKYERFAMELGAKRFLPGALKSELVLGAVEEVLAAAKTPELPPAEKSPPANGVDVLADSERLRLQISERLVELESLQDKLARTARFSQLFDGNPAAMWLVERNTHQMLAANEAALSLFGYGRQEFMALGADGLMNGGEVATFGATTVITYRHKDGRVLSLLTISKEMDFDGRDAELVVAHDLSYRVRAERKVVEEAQRLRALFACLPDALCMVDGEGRIVDVNDRYCELSGYTRDELLRLTLADLEPGANSRDASTRYQASHLHKSGSRWPADVSVSAANGTSGRRVLLIRQAMQLPIAELQRPASPLPIIVEQLREVADLDESTQARQMLAVLGESIGKVAALYATDKNLQDARLLATHGQLAARAQAPLLLPASSMAKLMTDSMFIANASGSGQLSLSGVELKRAAVACASLDKDEQLILVVGNGERDYRDEDAADLLAAVRLLAWSMARKRAGAQTLASLHRADVTVQGMVEVLCRVSDQHDPHTAGSSSRVAALAVAMARTMGMGGEQQHAVYLAARLHDIGNIGIPKEILGRPLLLGEHELAYVRTHAEQGAKLLAGIDLGGDIADIVHQHHERLDGSGYPRGLKQAAILPEAKILAIADVVEAMCSPRPHRQPLGLEAALAEISQGSGTLYDQQAAAACIRLFKEEGFQWPR